MDSAAIARRAWATLVAALLLWVFFDASKHSSLFSPFAPFGVDPYDVVGSFSFQVAIAIAALNLVRLGLMKRQGSTDGLRYVGRGITVVALCIAVTMASDTLAIVRAGLHPPRSPAEAALWAAVAGLMLVSAALLAAPRIEPAESAGQRVGAEFDWIFHRPTLRMLDPHEHGLRFAVVLALGMGVVMTAAEIVGDGPAPTLRQTILVILVRTGIEAFGVFVGLAMLGRYLGLVTFSRKRMA